MKAMHNCECRSLPKKSHRVPARRLAALDPNIRQMYLGPGEAMPSRLRGTDAADLFRDLPARSSVTARATKWGPNRPDFRFRPPEMPEGPTEVLMSGHKFKIGLLVNYLSRDGTSGVYQVTKLLPGFSTGTGSLKMTIMPSPAYRSSASSRAHGP